MPVRLLNVAIWVAATCAAADAQQTDSLGEKLRNALTGKTPHETAIAIYGGTSYDWSDMSFCMASAQVLFDYESIWPHRAPDGLGIRLEASAGSARGTEFSGERFITSGNFLAVYEFGSPKEKTVVPYVEGGVGLIYTDFQRHDQAYRLNFNPVAGAGIRMGPTFLVLRLHHLSNGGLSHDNRGINSVVLGLGIYL
jgi:lipid A 3-O-deacylase